MSPVFAHGQLRLYLLVLLSEAPRHGYEVIQDLEARFGGLYTPSAGTVYPRLSKLEDEGLVARSDEGRKATYRITEAGLAEVRARQREVRDLESDLDQSVRRLADQVRTTVQGRSADLRAELKAAAREARAAARPAGTTPPDPSNRPDGRGRPDPADVRRGRGHPDRWDGQERPERSGPFDRPDEPDRWDHPDQAWAGERWADEASGDRPWDDGREDDGRGDDGPWPGGFRGFGMGSPLSGFVFGSRSPGAGPDRPGGHRGTWPGSSAGSEWAELERAAYEVRDQARRAWRQHGLTADQTAELVAILADASRRISEVLRRSSRG